MKYIDNKAFPYPVLSPDNDDYTGCAFQAAIKWAVAADCMTLDAKFSLSDDNLVRLIKRQDAQFAVEVHCGKTYVRKMHTSYGDDVRENPNSYECSGHFEFSKGALSGQVTTNCYIISSCANSEFVSENFHSDYNESKFTIEEGYVLAVYPPITHYIDTEPHKPIGTFFRLALNNKIPHGQIQIGYDGDDYLEFMLHERTKSQIELMRKQGIQTKRSLWGGLYFPAILEILHEMQKVPHDHDDKRWFAGISKSLMALNPPVDISKEADLLGVVQRLLSNPIESIIPKEEN